MNEKGVKFYSDFIDALLRNNITPIVTLHHWDLPQVSTGVARGASYPEMLSREDPWPDSFLGRLGAQSVCSRTLLDFCICTLSCLSFSFR